MGPDILAPRHGPVGRIARGNTVNQRLKRAIHNVGQAHARGEVALVPEWTITPPGDWASHKDKRNRKARPGGKPPRRGAST